MSPTHTTDPLIAYASAEWNKSTLPAELFAGQRVPEHTWARYTLQAGSLKTVLSDIHQPMQYELSIQYPHRTMLAPRVRVVLDFLLNVMKNNAGLHTDKMDLRKFAAK